MAIRKIDLMHKLFGKNEAHTCGECENMVSQRYRGMILRKCTVYGMTHSEASDWAKKWTACGMFNKPYSDRNVIELVRPSREEEPVEGQLSIDGRSEEL